MDLLRTKEVVEAEAAAVQNSVVRTKKRTFTEQETDEILHNMHLGLIEARRTEVTTSNKELHEEARAQIAELMEPYYIAQGIENLEI